MKALSVRAPWWWFILHAGKDIENRDWSTRYRGPVYIHSSRWWVKRDVIEDCAVSLDCFRRTNFAARDEIRFDQMRERGGCLVGMVDIVDCVTGSASPWFFGQYGFVLARPVAFKLPIPCNGCLGFFEVPADVESQIAI